MTDYPHPCIGVCVTIEGKCIGCRCYPTEILDWDTYDEEDRAAVYVRVEAERGFVI